MASFTERLGYLITANGQQAIREFQQVRTAAHRDLGGTETLLNRFGANAKGFGAGLRGFGAGLLASFGLGAVQDMTRAASELEQSVGAIESVFGDAGDTILAFGESAAQTAGLSKREVNEMGAQLGAVLQGLGLSAEDAAAQVINLEKRGADMAATYGGTTAEAVHAVTRALVGERDPIEKYGGSMKQAEVDARVMALGLDTSTVAARKQAEAIATLDIIYEKTANTANQFSREQDSAAGAAQRARAEYENAQAELGDRLLPTLTRITEGLSRIAQAAADAGDQLEETFATPKWMTPVDRWLSDVLPDWLFGTKDVAEASRDAADAQEDLGDSVDALIGRLGIAGAAVESYGDALDDTLGARLDSADASRDLASAEERLRETLYGTGEAAEHSTGRIRTYQDALGDIFGSVVEVDEAHVRATDAVDGLREALGEAGRSSEDAAAFMKRYYEGGSRDADNRAGRIVSATAAAVRAAEAEVEAMAESGEIADTAQARKQALLERLVALKEEFPATTTQIDRYIDRLRRVPNLTTDAETSTRNLSKAKRDLSADTDAVVEAARREAEQQTTAEGRYRRLIELLEQLKRKYPELAAAIQIYIDDVNRAWEGLAPELKTGFTGGGGGDFGGHGASGSWDAPTDKRSFRGGGASGSWQGASITLNVNGNDLSATEVAELTSRKLGWALTDFGRAA